MKCLLTKQKEISNLVKTYRNYTKKYKVFLKWSPAPPHPRLGKTKLPRGKTNRTNHLFEDLHAFYQKDDKLLSDYPKNVPT